MKMSSIRSDCQKIVLCMLLAPSSIVSAKSTSESKSCEFKEAGLLFQTQLIREKGVLTGYEVSMKNIGMKDLENLSQPSLAYEAAHAYLYEKTLDGKTFEGIGSERKAYPIHGAPGTEQLRFRGPLKVGETKIYRVDLSQMFVSGRTLRNDRVYDISISLDFRFYPSDWTWEKASDYYGQLRSDISIQGCMKFTGVKMQVQ